MAYSPHYKNIVCSESGFAIGKKGSEVGIFLGTGATNTYFTLGVFNSTTAGYAVELERATYTAAMRVYADDGADALYAAGSVPDIRAGLFRFLVTADQTGGNVRLHGLMGQLKAYCATATPGKWNGEVGFGVSGRFEAVRASGTQTFGGYGITAAVGGVTATSGTITVDTNHVLAGVAAVSDFRATLTQTGKTAGLYVAKYDATNWSDATARTTWGYGLLIQNSSSAIGISIGSATQALVLPGTYSANAVDFSGTFNGHAIYIHPTALATGKRAIRIGDYGTEIPLAAGDGLYRSYAKIASGTDGTAVDFYWVIAETNGDVWLRQSQVESQAPTTGPKTITVESFYAGLADTKYLAASTATTEGLVATQHKVYGSVGSVCNGHVAAIWTDNQMSCTVGGTEASIRSSTGGVRPDGWAWLTTTSSGWDSLFYFDSTMASAAPLSTKKPTTGDTSAYDATGSFIININGTLYYVPYYEVGHCS